jgi:hypothetical protein
MIVLLRKVSEFPATSGNPFLGRKRLEGERVESEGVSL